MLLLKCLVAFNVIKLLKERNSSNLQEHHFLLQKNFRNKKQNQRKQNYMYVTQSVIEQPVQLQKHTLHKFKFHCFYLQVFSRQQKFHPNQFWKSFRFLQISTSPSADEIDSEPLDADMHVSSSLRLCLTSYSILCEHGPYYQKFFLFFQSVSFNMSFYLNPLVLEELIV